MVNDSSILSVLQMVKFLIQTVDNKIVHDFCFELIKAIDFQKWKGYSDMSYILSDNVVKDKTIVPIGSVDFVTNFVQQFNSGFKFKPKNIPKLLLTDEFCGRDVYNVKVNGIVKLKNDKFVKSNDIIKFSDNGVKNEISVDGNYQISELVDIVSEYRCFIKNGKLVGVKHYCGDFKQFPNINTIDKMIETYNDAPCAYTLDIGILSDNRTVMIEVHDFFSCGLYGFSEYNILPFMYTQWWFQNVTQKNILNE